MLWQHEGYINVESFLDNIEKAWTAMHFQGKDVNEGNDSIQSDTANAALHIDESEKIENETPEILHPLTQNMPDIEDCSNENDPKSFPESAGAIQLSNQESSETKSNDVHEGTSSAPVIVERKSTTNPTTIHLSIRMPSGSSLQEKFNFSDKLRSVKNYVDDNHDNILGSYDLAIPYPRKVFGAEDADKSLSELGFSARQALIVVPKLLPSRDIQTAATNQSTSNDNAIGYFGYFKKALSYINPFSYLGSNGGSSSLEQASEDLWESGPKPGIQSSSSIETSRNPSSSNPQNSNAGSSRRTSGPFGSNIHTLRHNEDDFRSSDRNTFWNGNSTQYGGNDK